MKHRRILIVDGYNVIRQTPPYSVIADNDLDAARMALISDVAAFAHGEWTATVVFDGHANERSDGASHRVAGITVIFSRFGMDADALIEGLARESRVRGDETVVVTSDAETQWTVLGGSVGRMSSAEFAGELRQVTIAALLRAINYMSGFDALGGAAQQAVLQPWRKLPLGDVFLLHGANEELA